MPPSARKNAQFELSGRMTRSTGEKSARGPQKRIDIQEILDNNIRALGGHIYD